MYIISHDYHLPSWLAHLTMIAFWKRLLFQIWSIKNEEVEIYISEEVLISIQSTVKETKAVVLHQDSLSKKFLCLSIVPQKDGKFAYGIRTSVETAVPCSTKNAIILLFSAKQNID